jgi:hypothetical protein
MGYELLQEKGSQHLSVYFQTLQFLLAGVQTVANDTKSTFTCRAVQIGIIYEHLPKAAMENGDIDIRVQACGRTLRYANFARIVE